MKDNNLISIIIPVYNAAKYLEETIKSIEKQTYRNYEAIFVDDGSTDNSVEIIEKYRTKNPKIKIIKVVHQGVSKARNIGLDNAQGRYLTFLDSDDIWLPNKLEEQINFIKKNNYALIYCNYRYISDDGRKISKEIKTVQQLDYNKALKNIRILTISVMIDLNKISKELCYMPDIMNEDIATWWKILKNGFVAYGQDKVLVYCRQAKNSRSSKKHITVYYRWKLYRNYEKLNLFKSIYYFLHYAFNGIIKRITIKKDFSDEDIKLQVAVSTMDIENGEEVNDLLKKMNIKTDYVIVNQTAKNNLNIKNENVITKYEKGLSKSRNIAIENAKDDIILLSDDDVIYENDYEKTIIEAWNKYKDADIICFYVKSRNPKRKTKKIRTGKIGYLKSMKVVSFEISLKKETIQKNRIKFDENFGAGNKNNRGEEQIFLWDALKKDMKIIFVNKKIGEALQEKSTWFKGYNSEFFKIQGKIFKRMSPRYYRFLVFQYAIRKYPLYNENISMKEAIDSMLGKN